MGRPVNAFCVHKTAGLGRAVDLEEHVRVLVVAGRRHYVVLRAEGVSEVDPLVPVSGDDQLDRLAIAAQERMQAVVLELGGGDDPNRIVNEDQRRFAFGQLRLHPLQLHFAERAGSLIVSRRADVPGFAEEAVQL